MSRLDLRRGSLLEEIAGPLPDELVSVLASGAGVRIERIVSRGHATPEGAWYDQDEDEFVLLVAGAARIAFEDGSALELTPGDWVDLPAHLRHRVAWTAEGDDTVWLAVFRPAT